MKLSTISDAVLDWAVAKCEGVDKQNPSYTKGRGFCIRGGMVYAPSTDWAQVGPIISRMMVTCHKFILETDEGGGYHCAMSFSEHDYYHGFGPTPLIAFCRCYVASQWGGNMNIEIEPPAELFTS